MQLSNPMMSFPAQAPGERRRFNTFAALVLSFFSADLYRDVGRRWRGIGFWYLVLLIVITMTPVLVLMQLRFTQFVRNDAPAMLKTFPTITIQDGSASIDRPEPFLWRDPKSGKVLLYVDTKGTFDLPEGADALVKLSKHEVILPGQPKGFDLKGVPNRRIDRQTLSRWLPAAATWAIPAYGVFAFVVTVILRLIQVLIFAAIGLAISSGTEVNLGYAALMRLSAVALTPAFLVGLALAFTGLGSMYFLLLYLAMEIGYLVVGIKSNRLPIGGGPGGYAGYSQQSPYTPYPGVAPQAGPYAPPPAQYPPGPLPPAQW